MGSTRLGHSTAFTYGDRIRAVISHSGISNLASFVEHTEGWRCELQRAEFGDERDAKTREFMEHMAPLNNAQKMKKPLLIIQGQNDPRVPVSEAARLVVATKDRIPVWHIVAKDEGHGFVQQTNRYKQCAAVPVRLAHQKADQMGSQH
jgi:dipeptidyl aminopeptidase/acylaminoacyl peptidase